MSTFAERQHASWSAIAHATANQRTGELAAVMLGAIEAYQPFDFQPGIYWDDLLEIWRAAPHSHCRAHAIAALVDIQHALKEYLS